MPEKKSVYTVINLEVLNRCFKLTARTKIVIFISAVKYGEGTECVRISKLMNTFSFASTELSSKLV